MDIISRKNFIIVLAGVLVVGMGLMALSLTRRPEPQTAFEQEIKEIEMQSESDDLDAIEEDLEETELSDIDSELQDIDRELDQAY